MLPFVMNRLIKQGLKKYNPIPPRIYIKFLKEICFSFISIHLCMQLMPEAGKTTYGWVSGNCVYHDSQDCSRNNNIISNITAVSMNTLAYTLGNRELAVIFVINCWLCIYRQFTSFGKVYTLSYRLLQNRGRIHNFSHRFSTLLKYHTRHKLANT